MEKPNVFCFKTTIECPSGLEEIIPTLVELEAEKIIPLPLEEVVWNYHYSFFAEQETIEATYHVTSKEGLEAAYCQALASGNESKLTAFCASWGLFPPSLRAARLSSQRRNYWQLLAIILNFFLLSCSFYWAEQAAHFKIVTTQIALLLHQEKKNFEKSACLASAAHEFKKEEVTLTRFLEEQRLWPELINELHQKLPPRFLWITKLSPVFEKSISNKGVAFSKKNHLATEEVNDAKVNALAIEGLYLENPRQSAVIDDWVENLKKSPLFALNNKKEEEIILSRTPADHTAYAYPFKMLLPLSTME